MTDEHLALAATLLQPALDHTDHPARAASVLVTAAAGLLARTLGEAQAIDMLTQGLDEAGALLRARVNPAPPAASVH